MGGDAAIQGSKKQCYNLAAAISHTQACILLLLVVVVVVVGEWGEVMEGGVAKITVYSLRLYTQGSVTKMSQK